MTPSLRRRHGIRNLSLPRADSPSAYAVWDGAVGDDAVVADASQRWREEVAYAEAFVDRAESLDVVSLDPALRINLREVLVHLIEEYARHGGHADLVRECIDGRTGQ